MRYSNDKRLERKPMVFDKIKKYLVEVLCIEPEKVTMEANLIDDLDFDEMCMIEFFCFIEDEFSVEIPEDEPDNYRTVGDAVRYIEWML